MQEVYCVKPWSDYFEYLYIKRGFTKEFYTSLCGELSLVDGVDEVARVFHEFSVSQLSPNQFISQMNSKRKNELVYDAIQTNVFFHNSSTQSLPATFEQSKSIIDSFIKHLKVLNFSQEEMNILVHNDFDFKNSFNKAMDNAEKYHLNSFFIRFIMKIGKPEYFNDDPNLRIQHFIDATKQINHYSSSNQFMQYYIKNHLNYLKNKYLTAGFSAYFFHCLTKNFDLCPVGLILELEKIHSDFLKLHVSSKQFMEINCHYVKKAEHIAYYCRELIQFGLFSLNGHTPPSTINDSMNNSGSVAKNLN